MYTNRASGRVHVAHRSPKYPLPHKAKLKITTIAPQLTRALERVASKYSQPNPDTARTYVTPIASSIA